MHATLSPPRQPDRLSLLLRLHSEMRVHPGAAERQQHAEPLPLIQHLVLAVPANGQNQDRLDVADDVERQGRGAADDEELRQVDHGRHDAGAEHGPEVRRGHRGHVRYAVDEGHEGDEHQHGDGRLVQEELGTRDGEVFDLLADPDLVQGCGAECEDGDDDAE